MPIKFIRKVYNEVVVPNLVFGEVEAPETVVFDFTDSHYRMGDGIGFTHSNKLWFKRPPKEHMIYAIMAHEGGKYFCIETYTKHYDIDDNASRSEWSKQHFPRPFKAAETGGIDCKSQSIEGVIDCVKQKYNVNVEIKGITKEELNRRAQESIENWISPPVYPISFLSMLDSNSDKILADMKSRLDSFCIAAKVGEGLKPEGREFALQACKKVLENIARDLELCLPNNVDWDEALEKGTVKSEFRKLLNDIYESHISDGEECEEQWRVASPPPPRKLSKGEEIGQRLWDVCDRDAKAEVCGIGDVPTRKREAGKCGDAAKLFLSTYSSNMKKIVEQLR